LFSRTTVDAIAIAKALIDLGIAATPAHRAATKFAGLFEFGRTLLVVGTTGAQIVNAEFNAALTDICGRPFHAAIVLDVGQVIQAVDQALNLTKEDNK
jgi:hypothetical protein